MKINLVSFFACADKMSDEQRQYEAIRAVVVENKKISVAAKKFGYKPASLKSFINQVKTGKRKLFPKKKRGPEKRQTSSEIIEKIINIRRKLKLNSNEIADKLTYEKLNVSARTIQRILTDAGFPKLRRRTNIERGITKSRTLISKRSGKLDVENLKNFTTECQIAGLFFFVPYIIESGILSVIKNCFLPESNDIQATNAALSMLALKLIGWERLSQISSFDSDNGLGIFAGLNLLPKASYITSWSYRMNEEECNNFQKKVIANFDKKYDFYKADTINLDFHTIPHYGEESELEKVWSGAKNKVIKGSNTFLAQDGNSDCIVYSSANIPRKTASCEIQNFVDYWIDIKGVVKETLVFDSKLTNYSMLNELDKQGIKFITLRRRGNKIYDNTDEISEDGWEKIKLDIPKRKYKKLRVHERKIKLDKIESNLREIVITDNGREKPTFVITNDFKMLQKTILMIYARRWHIENTLSELVHFFKMNALSSPIMVSIHFDMLLTIIAHTIYATLRRELKGFEKKRASSIFKKFINMPGRVSYDGKEFTIKIRKRATTPILKSVKKLNQSVEVPWLDNKPLRIEWTA
ncbi:MAG: helix-turn-helix domain-containing protein [Candidatus Omnitrophica bacterium]|nr:helix-turn-helix domain-containing protein [Candidatus Omnitrophota bacterium]